MDNRIEDFSKPGKYENQPNCIFSQAENIKKNGFAQMRDFPKG
jgi:hypothetical protein